MKLSILTTLIIASALAAATPAYYIDIALEEEPRTTDLQCKKVGEHCNAGFSYCCNPLSRYRVWKRLPWPYSYLHPSRLPNDTVRISQRPCAKASSPLIATMAILPVHLLFLRCCTFVLLIVQSVQAGSYRCDAQWMGRPKLRDCRTLFSQLPFATTHGDGQLDATRLFIEPQFLTPPFSPVENPFPVNSMVQLPKIWRYNSCRIALMSYADRSPHSTAYFEKPYVYRRKANYNAPVMVVYVYEDRALFEGLLNKYMSGSKAIKLSDLPASDMRSRDGEPGKSRDHAWLRKRCRVKSSNPHCGKTLLEPQIRGFLCRFTKMTYLVQLIATTVVLWGFAEANFNPICSKELFTWHTTPFADKSDETIRIFDEEQLQDTAGRSWSGVINPFQTRPVQVPRFRTRDGCNIAVMSFADPSALTKATVVNEITRSSATSWKNVYDAAYSIWSKCTWHGMGGAAVVSSGLLPGKPALSVFMWQSNAAFDAILNNYQNDPHGISPLDPRLLSWNETLFPASGGAGPGNVSVA
ncbi:hypothetical protein G7Y79_00013g035190 [Physcia stellaris]|nr:hypothetical protein G7Y79_00013g035190 [Physcia stellaris]